LQIATTQGNKEVVDVMNTLKVFPKALNAATAALQKLIILPSLFDAAAYALRFGARSKLPPHIPLERVEAAHATLEARPRNYASAAGPFMELGKCYADGTGTTVDASLALLWFIRALGSYLNLAMRHTCSRSDLIMAVTKSTELVEKIKVLRDQVKKPSIEVESAVALMPHYLELFRKTTDMKNEAERVLKVEQDKIQMKLNIKADLRRTEIRRCQNAGWTKGAKYSGACTNSRYHDPDYCTYYHQSNDLPPRCMKFARGECTWGEGCRYNHLLTTTESVKRYEQLYGEKEKEREEKEMRNQFCGICGKNKVNDYTKVFECCGWCQKKLCNECVSLKGKECGSCGKPLCDSARQSLEVCIPEECALCCKFTCLSCYTDDCDTPLHSKCYPQYRMENSPKAVSHNDWDTDIDEEVYNSDMMIDPDEYYYDHSYHSYGYNPYYDNSD
jgi:hypothetical protein